MIRVSVICENETQTVSVDPLSTPIDLIKLAFIFYTKTDYLPIALFNGNILDPNLSLMCQNVRDGDSVVLYKNNELFNDKILTNLQNSSKLPITTFDHKIQSILHEALNVKDKKINHFVSNPKTFRALQKLYSPETPIFEFQEPTYSTIIPPKADAPSTESIKIDFSKCSSEYSEDDSLSSCEDENEDDSSFSLMFESIEEAGKYIRKHSFPQWSW